MKITPFLSLLLCAAFWGGPAWAQEGTYTPPAGWGTELEKIDYDIPPVRGEKHSLLTWHEDPAVILDVRRWIVERDLRDLEPGWKVKQRMNAVPERIGKVMSCIGNCRIYRGTSFSSARWLSRLQEGDEVHTGPDSYLWLMLIDGALVRLSAKTSLSLLEVNIAAEEVFFQARLNQGYVHWQPRSGRQQRPSPSPDTDPLFLPLMDPAVNLEYFQRQLHQPRNDGLQITSYVDAAELGRLEQWGALNQLISANNKLMKRRHRYFLVTPNGSVLGQDVAVSWFYGVSHFSYFKLNGRDAEEEGERTKPWSAEFMFRGYANDQTQTLNEEKWMSVTPDGRTMEAPQDVASVLAVSELLPKRLASLMLARERWLAAAAPLWQASGDADALARDWGYRLWGQELSGRLAFLKEYTRRIETTNLRSLAKLTAAEKKDPAVSGAFDGRYFSRALDAYYLGIKQRYNLSRASVKDMKDLHYYGWMLKNARQQ